MRLFFFCSLLSILVLSNSDCKKKNKTGAAPETTTPGNKDAAAPEKYKGRLEVAGICKNYTISVTDGNIDKKLVVEEWTDEATGKKYSNAFKLGNPCEFPEQLKAGSEFYFVIDTSQQKECMVCMAYYPTPPKSLSIKVVE